MVWNEIEALPVPSGLKGMYAGTNNGYVMIVGGSHFPVPRAEGGSKVCSDLIFLRSVQSHGEEPWVEASRRLPEGRAEGAAVSTAQGVVAVGGINADGPLRTVCLLTVEAATKAVRLRSLPDLPVAVSSAPVTYWQGQLFVALMEDAQTTAIWSLDLAAALAPDEDAQWQRRATAPGPARAGPVLAVLGAGKHAALHLLGGKQPSRGGVASSDYLSDGWRLELARGVWQPIAAMPRPALVPGVLASGSNHLIVMGGSDGHDIERVAELGAAYRLPDDILAYDANRNSWSVVGRMPLGVVAPAVVSLGDRWLIAGGEFTPAVRTNRVFSLQIFDSN